MAYPLAALVVEALLIACLEESPPLAARSDEWLRQRVRERWAALGPTGLQQALERAWRLALLAIASAVDREGRLWPHTHAERPVVELLIRDFDAAYLFPFAEEEGLTPRQRAELRREVMHACGRWLASGTLLSDAGLEWSAGGLEMVWPEDVPLDQLAMSLTVFGTGDPSLAGSLENEDTASQVSGLLAYDHLLAGILRGFLHQELTGRVELLPLPSPPDISDNGGKLQREEKELATLMADLQEAVIQATQAFDFERVSELVRESQAAHSRLIETRQQLAELERASVWTRWLTEQAAPLYAAIEHNQRLWGDMASMLVSLSDTLQDRLEMLAADREAEDADLETRWQALWSRLGQKLGDAPELLAWLETRVWRWGSQARELFLLESYLGERDGRAVYKATDRQQNSAFLEVVSDEINDEWLESTIRFLEQAARLAQAETDAMEYQVGYSLAQHEFFVSAQTLPSEILENCLGSSRRTIESWKRPVVEVFGELGRRLREIWGWIRGPETEEEDIPRILENTVTWSLSQQGIEQAYSLMGNVISLATPSPSLRQMAWIHQLEVENENITRIKEKPDLSFQRLYIALDEMLAKEISFLDIYHAQGPALRALYGTLLPEINFLITRIGELTQQRVVQNVDETSPETRVSLVEFLRFVERRWHTLLTAKSMWPVGRLLRLNHTLRRILTVLQKLIGQTTATAVWGPLPAGWPSPLYYRPDFVEVGLTPMSTSQEVEKLCCEVTGAAGLDLQFLGDTPTRLFYDISLYRIAYPERLEKYRKLVRNYPIFIRPAMSRGWMNNGMWALFNQTRVLVAQDLFPMAEYLLKIIEPVQAGALAEEFGEDAVVILALLGEEGQAIELGEQLLESEPRNLWLHHNLTLLYLWQADQESHG